MDREKFNELMPWLMLNAMYLRLIFLQGQLQRPLTPEEVEMSHHITDEEAQVMLDGYRQGYEAAKKGEKRPPDSRP